MFLLRRFIAPAAIVGVALLLAGTPAAGAPEMPRYGGVYIKNNIYQEPASMDPIFALTSATIMIQMNIFDGLVRVDPERNEVVPDIAERWTHSPDGKTFTFSLRKGILFHDGSEVTADDFKYHFERVANPDNLSPNMARLAGVVGLEAFQGKRAQSISGIVVIDKYTLRIAMERSNILLPYYLTGVWASAVPRRVVERLGKEFGTKPVGSGPFMFESWTRGREVVLRKSPNYWRKDKWGSRLPYVDKVVFPLILDMPAVEAAIEAGDIDSSYIRDTAYQKYKTHPLFRNNLVEGVEFYTSYVAFNLDTPGAPWRDKRVRQAVNHAIDRKVLVDVVRHGMAYPATGALPLMIRDEQPIAGYEYNPEKAKQLLSEAGYPRGFSAKILTRSAAHYPAVAEAVAGYLNAVGIHLQIEALDTTSTRAREQDGKFELVVGALGGEGHPLLFLQRGFHSRYAGPAGNSARFRNPVVDQLLDRAAAARDANTMIRLVRDAEKTIVDEAPWAFLFYLKGVVVHQPYVRGLRVTSIDMDWQPLEEVWLTQSPKRR